MPQQSPADATTLDRVIVTGRRQNLVGEAISASEGSVSQTDIAEHLENCPSCQDEALVARTLTDVVARACKESAPEELRDQVLERLRAVQATH